MKRGLKDKPVSSWLEDLAEDARITPMKRGLKGLPSRRFVTAWKFDARITPMKRGLKVRKMAF